jgi:hypothetical protein
MAFNIGIGTTIIASQTEDGIPYLWGSGDISTPPTFVGVLTGFEPWIKDSNSYYMSDRFGWDVDIGNGTIVVGAPYRSEDNYTPSGVGTFRPGGVYVFDIGGDPVGLASRVHTSTVTANARHQLGYKVAVGSGKIAATSLAENSGTDGATGSYPAVDGEQRIWYLDGTGGVAVDGGNTEAGFSTSICEIDIAFGKLIIGDTHDDLTSHATYGQYQRGGQAYVKGLQSKQWSGSNVHHDIDRPGVGTTLGRSYSGAPIITGYKFGKQVAASAGMYFVAYNDHYLSMINYDGRMVNEFEGSSFSSGTAYFDKIESACGRLIYGGSQKFRIYGMNTHLVKEINIYSSYSKYIIDMAVGSGRVGISISSSTVSGINEEVLIYDLDGNLIQTISKPSDLGSRWWGKSLAIGHGRIVIGAPATSTYAKIHGRAYLYKTPEVLNFYDLLDMHGKF